MDTDTVLKLLLASIISAIISGLTGGIRMGIEKRVSSWIAGPRRRNKKHWPIGIFWFLIIAAIAYGVMEYWPVLFLLFFR